MRDGKHVQIDLQIIEKRLEVQSLRIVADRRGSLLLRGVRNGRDVALKLCRAVEDTYDRNALLLHEGALVRELQYYCGLEYLGHGEVSDIGPWLLTGWADGTHPTVDDFPVILNAYAAIHERGYLHRDVQPRHLLMKNEHVVILDWGLGRGPNNKNPNYFGALVHYAAPEVARQMLKGEQIDYSVQTEVYSLGATLYFLLTGETPVDYGSEEMSSIPFPEKLARVAEGNIRPSNIEHPALPGIRRALSLHPSDRFDSATSFLQAIESKCG